MFRFRGKRKDNGEWVVGCYCEKYSRACIYNKKDGFWYEIHQDSLSISTGKLDSKGAEIFASFEIDGVMTTGGDAVSVPRWKHLGDMPVTYSAIWSKFIVGYFELSSADSNEITIIPKEAQSE